MGFGSTNAISASAGGGGESSYKSYSIIIPEAGWTNSGLTWIPYQRDIEVPGVISGDVGQLIIDVVDLEEAEDAGIIATADTFNGYIRIYAMTNELSRDIHGTLTIFRTEVQPTAADYIQDGLVREWEFSKGLFEKVGKTFTTFIDGPQTFQYDVDMERYVGFIRAERFGTLNRTDILDDTFDFDHFTLQALAKFKRNTWDYQMCFGFVRDTGDNMMFVMSAYSDGKLIVEHSGGHSSASASPYICDNEWHTIAASYDGEKVRMYCDGVKVGEETRALQLSDTKYIFFAHWQSPALPMSLDSCLANCCIYGRVLSDDEIAANWNIDRQRYGIGGA